MAEEPVAAKIQRHFDFLFEKFGFRQTAELHFPEHFGNWVIVLQAQNGRIRFLQDRGEIIIAFSPSGSPSGWEHGPWYELSRVIGYLTRPKLPPEFEKSDIDRQLEQQAGVLRSYSREIINLFHGGTFEQHRIELDQYNDVADEVFWSGIASKS